MKKATFNINALKSKMAAKGFKQYTFAKAIKVSNPTMTRMFSGLSSPTLEVIQRMANILELTDSEFAEIFYNKEGAE